MATIRTATQAQRETAHNLASTRRSVLIAQKNMGIYQGEIPEVAEMVEFELRNLLRKSRKPAMSAEERKAAATAKKQSNLSIQGRCQFKATGHILIQIEDRNGKAPETFHTTVINGKVTSCINTATGETCDGRHWSGHCCHGDRALQYEATRLEELHGAAVAAPLVLGESFAQDVEQHAEDDYGDLPGTETMVSDDPWADPNYDPFKGMTEDEKRAARFYAFENEAA